jgi:hypothetical protein
MTQIVGELAKSETESVEILRPLDEKILGGIALCGYLDDESVISAMEKLQESFDQLREEPLTAAKKAAEKNAKPQTEFGRCVAYSLPNLETEEAAHMDSYLLDIARRQNHGMRTVPLSSANDPSTEVLWKGFDPNTSQKFVLFRKTGGITLSNFMPHPGTLYALKSQVSEDKKANWGWM